MPVLDKSPYIAYVANGATSYAYDFRVFKDTDLVVSVAGAVKTLATDYTVTGVGADNGGEVVFTVPPVVGSTIEIERILPLSREIDYQYGGAFREQTVDDDQDYQTMLLQQLQSGIDRTLRVPKGQTGDAVDIVEYANRAGKVLGWNSFGKLALMAMSYATSSGVLANPWVDVRGYASLADAVAQLGGTTIDLHIPNLQAVTADLTIPANIRLVVPMGGMLTVSSGKTVTIAGAVSAGIYQIFTGAGTVTVTDDKVLIQHPEWWGTANQHRSAIASKRYNAAQRFAMNVRSWLPTFPVPCIRPETANTVIAVDVMPNGTPADDGTNGKAWIDVCDADIMDNNNAVTAARVGITSTNVEFGSRSYSGASPKPIYFTVNGDPVVALQTTGNVNVGGAAGVNGLRQMALTNYSAGTSAHAEMKVGCDLYASRYAIMRQYSSTFAYDSGNYANKVEVGAVGGGDMLVTSAGNVWLLPGGGAFSAINYGVVAASAGHFSPKKDNNQALGQAAYRWSVVYAATGSINTSDERVKQDIEDIPVIWLEAWGAVQFQRFRFRDAVMEKGAGARWHVGVIAQRVKEAFESRGLDPLSTGILCLDTLEDGTTRYGIRYEEALALECAYLRWRLEAIS